LQHKLSRDIRKVEAEVNKLTQQVEEQAKKKKLEKDKSSIQKELRERKIRKLNLVMYSTGGRGR
jgi:hypothetical protein